MLDLISSYSEKVAVIFNNQEYKYSWLVDKVESIRKHIKAEGIVSGDVVSLFADYSPLAMALLLALLAENIIVTLISNRSKEQLEVFSNIAAAKFLLTINQQECYEIKRLQPTAEHALVQELRAKNEAGLIIFSSGSTGSPKAIVHSAQKILAGHKKLANPKSWKVISFLLFDHIGGINTLFTHLINGNTLVVPASRTPDDVARTIEYHRVQALVTSPTFINLFLLNQLHQKFDLSSLEVINYSTEPMPEGTLKRMREVLPSVKLKQSYGSSETGVIHTQSLSSDSLYIKMEGCDTRIVAGQLQIKSNMSMLGYLNAPSPFTEDGWYKTGDVVQVDGEYLQILGRASEIINIGGEKVYPAEVENIILMMPGVVDVVISGEPHMLMGWIIKATVVLEASEDLASFRRRLNQFCKDKLPRYKLPQKIILSQDVSYNERFKKMRKGT